MPFSNPAEVLAQVNEWARRNTEGLIDPMLKEMNPNAVAYLMNALYFKAKWQGGEYNPMFSSDFTYDDTFYRADGSKTTVPFMSTSRSLPYADMGSYEIVALPYASGDFELGKTLQALGMRRAFDEVQAEFGNLFEGVTPGFYISRVLQKAKMTVAEWGTEAAAVTVVEMAEKSALPGKVIPFVADHPFVFVLGEQDSGTILFEGVYTGK